MDEKKRITCSHKTKSQSLVALHEYGKDYYESGPFPKQQKNGVGIAPSDFLDRVKKRVLF